MTVFAVRPCFALRSWDIGVSHLLAAIDRKPNTDTLGLEAAGVQFDRHGFTQTNEYLQTNVESIWELVDCNFRGAFTPLKSSPPIFSVGPIAASTSAC